jgi:4-hydroxy-tetrahydrodipicolinate reductase
MHKAVTYRVIQWATGNVGHYALRGIVNHPELELVGLWVHSPEKAGRDAAELCGLSEPTGVLATNDADALLAMDADAVCYTATADLRPFEAQEDLVRILRSGKNVVSCSIVPMVWPPHAGPAITDPIEEACREGSVSCFTSGVDPGFFNDIFPLLLSGACERVDSIRCQEILNYATYDQPTVLFETIGFGQPMDATPILLLPGVLTLAWGATVEVLAAGLGVELERVEEWHERLPAPETFEVLGRPVEEGTMAGLRFEIRGIVDGEPRIVIEHVSRLHDAVGPEWPAPPGKGGGYRVVIEGSPRLTCEVTMEGDGGDENAAGLLVTAMRCLNAVPAVCAAPPGLLSALDLPLVVGPFA